MKERASLDRGASGDPMERFVRWFDEAEASGVSEPGAMALATVGADGRPSVRMVLLRGHDATSLHFFTNYESRKALDLSQNAHAALVFHWPTLRRQCRVEGRVDRLPPSASDAYFARRSRGSQLAAWASAQSRPIEGHATLEAEQRRREEEFAGREVSRPPFWGGYELRAERMEFWRAGEHRLHRRELYVRSGATWLRSILAP